MISFLNPTTVHGPAGAYSHSARVPAGTELVFISGQVGTRLDGTTPAGLAEQADQVFANIVQILAAHGMVAGDIVKLTLFIVAGQDIQTVRAARVKHLGTHKPTSTAIFISQLADPKWQVEVEAVAARAVPA